MRLADICFLLNIEDTYTVNYALQKLPKADLVTGEKYAGGMKMRPPVDLNLAYSWSRHLRGDAHAHSAPWHAAPLPHSRFEILGFDDVFLSREWKEALGQLRRHDHPRSQQCRLRPRR